MMLEEAIAYKHRYFNYCGAYSVAKKKSHVLCKVSIHNELLSDAW